jgi:hypothetical protein
MSAWMRAHASRFQRGFMKSIWVMNGMTAMACSSGCALQLQRIDGG